MRLIESAADYGRVWVALNSDEWLYRKKGYYFMTWAARAAILLSMRDVAQVVPVDDSDGTVCEALRRIQPNIFVNGGDRVEPNQAEAAICLRYGIRQVFKAGGVKTESSSELIKRVLRSAPRDPNEDSLQG